MVSHFITKRNKLTINFNLNESHYFKYYYLEMKTKNRIIN